MNPLLLLVFVVFLDSPLLATAEDEPSPAPLSGATYSYEYQRTCPSQIIKIQCKAREDAGQAGEIVLADCYTVNIGGKRHTDLTGQHLLLKVEQNITADDEGTHLTAQLQFQTECSSTAETITAIFTHLVDKNVRHFDPCEYLDGVAMVCVVVTGFIAILYGLFYCLN